MTMSCDVHVPLLDISAELHDVSFYSVVIFRNRSEVDAERLYTCERTPLKTKSPEWMLNETRAEISARPGTYGFTVHVQKYSSSFWSTSSKPELIGKAFVSFPTLLLSRSFDAPIQENTRAKEVVGVLHIKIGGMVDSPNATRSTTARPSSERLRELSNLSQDLDDIRQYVQESAAPSLDFANAIATRLGPFMRSDLERQMKCFPGIDIDKVVGNPGNDLLAQVKLQVSYFRSHCHAHSALCDLLPALTQVLAMSLTLMFAYAATYLGNTYRILQQHGLADVTEQCQLEHMKLRMQMISVVEGVPVADLNDSPPLYLSTHAVDDFMERGVPEDLSGPYVAIIGCARGTFAQDLQQAWKEQINARLADCCDPWPRVRDVQRRFMAYVTREAGVLPKTLEIPSKDVEEETQEKAGRVGPITGTNNAKEEFEIPPDADDEIVPYSSGIAARSTKITAPTSGSQGTVKRGKWFAGAQHRPLPVAIKEIHADVQQDKLSQLYLEIIAGWTMRHPRIVEIKGITHHSRNISLILPWYENGDSQGYLRRRLAEGGRKRFIREINKLLCQVAEGLAYLRQEFIIHGDLSSRNVLIDDNGDAVIADFGLTIFATAASKQNESSRAGNPRWLAPEQHHVEMRDVDPGKSSKAQRLTTGRPTFESDLFSWSMLCIELYSGATPFGKDVSDYQVYELISNGRRPPWPALLDDEKMKRCIVRRWSQEPRERGTADELLQDMRDICSGS